MSGRIGFKLSHMMNYCMYKTYFKSSGSVLNDFEHFNHHDLLNMKRQV